MCARVCVRVLTNRCRLMVGNDQILVGNTDAGFVKIYTFTGGNREGTVDDGFRIVKSMFLKEEGSFI